MKTVKTDRNMWIVMLLSLITCGIYSLFYYKKVEEDVNVMCEGDGKTTQNYWIVFLLGMVTCGIYPIVWLYQTCERVYNSGARYGVETCCSGGTYLLWSLLGALLCGVGPFIAMHKSIKDLNAIGEAYNRGY